MKKFLLLTVLVLTLACLFVVSASAADELPYSTTNEWGTLITFDIGNTAISQLKDDGTIARTVLHDGNGKYYTVPTTCILSKAEAGGKPIFNFSWNDISTKLGFTVSKASIIRSEIPSDIAYVNNNEKESYNGCSNMIECIVNDGLRIWDNSERKIFAGCSSLKSIDISGMVLTNTNNAYSLFEYCSELESVVLPNAYEVDGVAVNYNTNYMFNGCFKLKQIENLSGFAKGVKIIKYKMFYNCYLLTKIELWNGLESIDNRTFSNCRSLTEIIFPDTVTTIGGTETAFEACTALKKIVFPSGAVTVGNYCFEKCTALTDVWMPGAGSTFAAQVFGQCGSSLSVNFYFTTATSTITISDKTNKDDPFITALGNEGDPRIKYNTPLSTKCTVFLGGHAGDDKADCTQGISCVACQTVIVTAFETHDTEITITYPKGFMAYGVKITDCSRDGCNAIYEKDEKVTPIVSTVGYSYREEGKGGLTCGFEISNDALKTYIDANPTVSVEFSLLVVNPKYLDEKGAFFKEDGTIDATQGAIQISVGSLKYATLGVKVTGFTVEQMSSIELAFALVAKVDGVVSVYQHTPETAKGVYSDTNGLKLDSVTVETVAPEFVAALKGKEEII